MTRMLIVKEKHDTRYFDISDMEKWAEVCVNVLRERLEVGYIYEETPYFNAETEEAMALSDEEVEALPEQIRDRFIKLRKNGQGELARVRSANENFREIERIVLQNDTSVVTRGKGRWERQEPLAWRQLELRSDHEYEGVEIEELR